MSDKTQGLIKRKIELASCFGNNLNSEPEVIIDKKTVFAILDEAKADYPTLETIHKILVKENKEWKSISPSFSNSYKERLLIGLKEKWYEKWFGEP